MICTGGGSAEVVWRSVWVDSRFQVVGGGNREMGHGINIDLGLER